MIAVKRQEQKVQTRQKILDTAFRLYSSGGFSVPTNRIAREAGVSHGAVFVHFSTRETLQLEVLERFTEEMGNKLHDLSKKGAGIRELLYTHIGILEEYESFYKNLISEISMLPEGTKTMLLTLQSMTSYHFDAVIGRERRRGTVKDIPLHMLFNTWIALLHYYLQNSELFAPGKSVLRRRKDELINTYISLISVKGVRRR